MTAAYAPHAVDPRSVTSTARSWRALGTYIELSVENEAAAAEAALAAAVLDDVDAACSRFRADSDLVRANQAAGQWVSVSPILIGALQVALRAAHTTEGLVDPTLGELMIAGGYDRTFSQIGGSVAPTRCRPRPPAARGATSSSTARRSRSRPAFPSISGRPARRMPLTSSP